MERRIALAKGEYYELKAKLLDVELHQTRLSHAKQGLQGVFLPLAKAHSFDPSVGCNLDDATCELVTLDAPAI
jgi:hypothetical protein